MRHMIVGALTVPLWLSILCAPISAAVVLDQENPLDPGLSICCGPSSIDANGNFLFRRMQTFTVGVAGVMDSIEVGLALRLPDSPQFLGLLNVLELSGADPNVDPPLPAPLIASVPATAVDVLAVDSFRRAWVRYDVSAAGLSVAVGDVLAFEVTNVPGLVGPFAYLLTFDSYQQGRLFRTTTGLPPFVPEDLDVGFRTFVEVPEVDIDINPASDPNSINCRHNGVIPVAILTTDTAVGEAVDFDATTVDPSTVGFGPNAATPVHPRAHIKDVDGDGDMDMVLHFRQGSTGIQCGDLEACLSGGNYWWHADRRLRRYPDGRWVTCRLTPIIATLPRLISPQRIDSWSCGQEALRHPVAILENLRQPRRNLLPFSAFRPRKNALPQSCILEPTGFSDARTSCLLER